MNSTVEITAVFDKGNRTQGNEVLAVTEVRESSGETFLEYHAEVKNLSDREIVLEKVILFHAESFSAYGIEPDYDIFRSGRHKNDMPGVFTTGVKDERLKDVSAAMSESGDRMEGGSGSRILSDHLTLIKGKEGNVLAIEFLRGRDQLFETEIVLDEDAAFKELNAGAVFNIILKPGETVKTESIRIAEITDEREEVRSFAKRKAELYRARNKRRPAVFCTWYYYGLTVSEEDVKTCLNIIKERKLPYDVFQVDEGWEITLGEFEPNHKFPRGMKIIAGEIREAGYIPGLWSSPFVAHPTAKICDIHPEWILKDRDGNPCLFPMNDTIYHVLDITNPMTRDYFTELYRKFTEDWGYVYHKLDFTRAAVIYESADFFDKTIPLARAYYEAVKAIRKGMGEESFFLMCGGLYDPIIGLVDAQRTGSDVLSMWSSNINKDGKTAPYTIRQSRQRCYMNAWFANDPDALMVRRNETMERNLRLTYGLLNEEEAVTSVINQFAGGGIMCQTEPMDKIDEDRLMLMRHILPIVETEVETLNLLSEDRFPKTVDVFVKKTGAHCLCVTNWSDTEEEELRVFLSDLSLKPGDYAVCGFHAGTYKTKIGERETVTLGTLKPHASDVIKIERMEDQPIIVKSNDHYSMGGECRELGIKDNTLIVNRPAILPVEVHYTILLPAGVSLNGSDIAEVTLKPGEEEKRIPLDVKEVH